MPFQTGYLYAISDWFYIYAISDWFRILCHFILVLHVPFQAGFTYYVIMSPPIKWGDILFLSPLSVRASVRLSVCHTFVSALYLLYRWWDLQITLHKCQVWWDDVQCLCLTKIGSRSRSEFKIKHCMTYQVQYRVLLLKKLTLFSMLHMGYSSPSVIALVYDFTSLYKKIWVHPVTYGGGWGDMIASFILVLHVPFQAGFTYSILDRFLVK